MDLKNYHIKTASRETIEAEEIFLDAQALKSMEEKGKLEQPIKRRNFIFFYLLILAGLLVLLVRAGHLQILQGEYYRNLADGNSLRTYFIPAPRGIIYDRHQEPLVHNLPNFDLIIDVSDFLANPVAVQEEILEKISVILERSHSGAIGSAGMTNVILEGGAKQRAIESRGKPALPAGRQLATGSYRSPNGSLQDDIKQDLKQKIEEAKAQQVNQLVLAENLQSEQVLILETLVDDWLGVRLNQNIQRHYSFGPALAHLLGYTSRVSPEDLAAHPDYAFNDYIGKSGLEFEYEDLLRGQLGQQQMEVDSLGRIIKEIAFKPPQAGQGLILHLDRQLQEKLYQSLKKMTDRLGVKKGAALALDPQSGGILALVSLPSFDNNLFAQGISTEDYAALENDPNKPFFNRAISGFGYPPGSTIKPFLAAAGLEEKVVQVNQTINCQGSLGVPHQYTGVMQYFLDWKAHGITDIIKAIAESCNVYFYQLAGGYGEKQGLGVSRIKKYLELFGLGQLTGIDLPDEGTGLIPDEDWKKEVKGERWYLGDTYHLGIGQGDIAVTPLQLTLATAAIANGGILYQPQLVDKVIDSSGHSDPERSEGEESRGYSTASFASLGSAQDDIAPKIVRENFIRSEYLKIVQQGMRQAVTTGSARALADLPVKVAGKTGTAQFGSQGKTHAWFTGFAPFEEPEIVLTILVEGGGEGYQAAVPVAKEVFSWYFGQKAN